MNVDLHLGSRLRRRRRLLGLTQEQLGHACDISFQQVQKYESATNRMSAARLWTFARALDVPLHYFFDGIEPDHTDRSFAIRKISHPGTAPGDQ
jgi:transcriptional regulator with XRE-family HTH domain